MATIIHKGKELHTAGDLPPVGTDAPGFMLTGVDLIDMNLEFFSGKRVVLNIFPSIDTSTCAASVRMFNMRAAQMKNTVVICVSRDLPFAYRRFCATEGIQNVSTGSEFRDEGFSSNYKVKLLDGTMAGLFSRCVVVINENGKIIHAEQVPDLGKEPDYEAVLSVLS